MTDDARHMTPATVDVYWNAGRRVSVPMPGSPTCQVVIDPSYHTVSLRSPLTGGEPDVAKMRNVSFHTETDGDETWGELRVTVTGSHHAALALVTTVADRLQIENESLALAVPHAINAYRLLLAKRSKLSDEQQRGLFGELLVLEHLMSSIGAQTALEAWHGPAAEEHDFFLSNQHLEVKTTTSESRRHVIGSMTQLTDTPNVPLWLVSIQLTGGVVGDGRTLPELVSDVRRYAGDLGPVLDARLEGLNWDDEDRDLYPDVWQLRSGPRAYRVEGEFPRITDELVGDDIPSRPLVSDVSYRIDVTTFPCPDRPQVLADFTETDGGHR